MTTAADALIVDSILDAIADQRLQAGTKLGEQALSDLFDCNRAHVRRALATLTAWQVVEHLPNRGAYVSTPTVDDARDIFQARRAIETTICRNVVRKATEADIAALRAHLHEEHAAEASNRPAAIRLTRGFHLLLARIAGNHVLLRYMEELTMRSSLIIGLYGSNRAALCADGEHDLLVDAIAARDEARALAALDDHLRGIERQIDFNRTVAPSNMLADALRPMREA